MPILRGTPSTIAGVLGGRGYRFIQQWLLRDNFTTDLAAGSVNGSSAEPGPGTRTVTDTENKLSISGGAAVFAGGKASPAWGDPGLWYGAQTRTAGLAFVAEHVSPPGPSKYTGLGWSAAQSGTPSNGVGLQITEDVIFLFPAINLQSISAATTYKYTVILRSTGSAVLVYLDGRWTLLWVGSSGTTTSLYPAAPIYNGAPLVNYIKVAQLSWLPVPETSDSFSVDS